MRSAFGVEHIAKLYTEERAASPERVAQAREAQLARAHAAMPKRKVLHPFKTAKAKAKVARTERTYSGKGPYTEFRTDEMAASDVVPGAPGTSGFPARVLKPGEKGLLFKSAFGVEVAKRDTVPEWMTSALPASTVMAYNKSRRRKTQAAASNLAAKTGGGLVGGLVGATALGLAAKRVPILRPLTQSSKVLGTTISAERKMGAAQAAAGGVVGGVTGGITGNRSLNRIKGDKRYGYRR